MDIGFIALGIVKLLGITLSLIAYGSTVKWGLKPEENAIMRLRPGGRLSNFELIIRAYFGAGLVSTFFFLLPWQILGIGDAISFFILIPIGTMFWGTGTYYIYRLSRYRKLTPEELQSNSGNSAGAFVLRDR